MKKSESIAKLASAFLVATRAINPRVLTNAMNSDHGSNYANLGALIDASRKELADAGIMVLQSPTTSERINEARLTTMLLHESGEWIEDTCSCPLEYLDPQSYGSAVTYLRRTSLGAMLLLFSADDDGQSATGHVRRPAQEKALPAPRQRRTSTAAETEQAPAAAVAAEGAGVIDDAAGNASPEEIPADIKARVEKWLQSCSNASLDRLVTSRPTIRETFKNNAAVTTLEKAFDERIATLRKAVPQPA